MGFLLNINDDWKNFGLGAVVGAGTMYGGPKLFKKLGDSLGDNVTNKLRAAQNPGYGQLPSPELYNGLMSTLNRLESRLTQLETAIYRKGE